MNDSCESRSCPRCGETIASGTLEGLCPKCLLQQVSIPTESGSDSILSGVAPALDELAKSFPQLDILELVGQGGMGFVFKARQAKLERFVALKIMRQSLAGEAAFAERFEREGRLLARLNHPNIVAVYDFGRANGFFYLLMEFVDGVNLRQALKAGRFTPDQALAIVPKICEALQFAHSEGILHRDIKPENILLDSKGRVKIADFGIAKLLAEPRSASTLTGTAGVIGTPQYMAPEQLEKAAHIDHRSDIYSLGVVFYEMLTGELPIGRFAAPSESCEVDQRLDEIVFRTLEKKPEHRPQSAGELKTEVESITQTPAHEFHGGLASRQRHEEVARRGAGAREEDNRASRRWSGAAVSSIITLAVIVILAAGWKVFRLASVNASDGAKLFAPGHEPLTREITLARATNQAIGTVQDTWTSGVWSDSFLEPGETLSARVSIDGGPLSESGCTSLLFTHSGPDTLRTSTALTWFFGGATQQGFTEKEAEEAAEQMRRLASGQPIRIKLDQPLELFSVTNNSGRTLRGYAELNRVVPKPTAPGSPKPQANLYVRRFTSFLPSMDYSVELPEGFALHSTVNMGTASTHRPVPVQGASYHTAWFIPSFFRAASSPGDFQNLPSQMNTQRDLLELRFRELQARGPITIVLGEPYPIFSLTNHAGEVYEACFELVGATVPGAKRQHVSGLKQAPTPAGAAQRIPSHPYATPQNRAVPTNTVNLAVPPGIDPATGLPVRAGTTAATVIDPATGLPAGTLTPSGTVKGPATHGTSGPSQK